MIMNLATLVVAYGVSHRLFDFAWKGQLRAIYPSAQAYQVSYGPSTCRVVSSDLVAGHAQPGTDWLHHCRTELSSLLCLGKLPFFPQQSM